MLKIAALAALAAVVVAPAESIPHAANKVRPLLVGAQVPDAMLMTPSGEEVCIGAAAREQPTILIFYRGGWCHYCSTHLADIARIEPELKKLGFQILAISPDAPETLAEAMKGEKPNYRVLSDADMAAAKALGIAFRVDDETMGKLKGYGIDIEAASKQTHRLLPVPAVFVSNAEGVVSFTYVNPDYKQRIDGDVLLAAAKSAVK